MTPLGLSVEEERRKAADVCVELYQGVSNNNGGWFDNSSHCDHLNSIEANNPFCAQIQRCYHKCFTCASLDLQLECDKHYGIQAHQGPMLSDSECTDLQICDRLQWTSFSNLSLSTIRNVSDHTKYHAWIHSSDPLCNASKKAYPKCKWCLDESDLCFNQLSPPSCEVALSDTNDTYLDAQSTENLCTQLHDSFEPDADMQGTLSNSSNLLLGPNQQLG